MTGYQVFTTVCLEHFKTNSWSLTWLGNAKKQFTLAVGVSELDLGRTN